MKLHGIIITLVLHYCEKETINYYEKSRNYLPGISYINNKSDVTWLHHFCIFALYSMKLFYTQDKIHDFSEIVRSVFYRLLRISDSFNS